VEVFPHAVDAVIRPAVGVIAERQERGHVVIGDEPHIAPSASVAAVRTAECDGAFTPEADTTRTAIAGTNVQLTFVDESTHSVIQANGGHP
jgi:hypothetical protein